MKYSNIALLMVMVASPMLYGAVSKDDKELPSKSEEERQYPSLDLRNYPHLLGPKSYYHNAWIKGSADERLAILDKIFFGDIEAKDVAARAGYLFLPVVQKTKLEFLLPMLQEARQLIDDVQGDNGNGTIFEHWRSYMREVQEIIKERQARHAKRKQMTPEFEKIIESGNGKELISYLAKNKAAINSVDEFGNSPLMVALHAHQFDRHGVPLIDGAQAYPLSDAIINQLLLIMSPEQIATANDDKNTPLHHLTWLAWLGNPKALGVMRSLMGKVPIDARDADGRTPLRLARRVDVARLLLANKADANALDGDGRSVFFGACFLYTYPENKGISFFDKMFKPYTQQDKEALLKVLLDHDANIDYKVNSQFENLTPLQYAVQWGDVPLVAFLLKHHASLHVVPILFEQAIRDLGAQGDMILHPNKYEFGTHQPSIEDRQKIIKLLYDAGAQTIIPIKNIINGILKTLEEPLAKDIAPKQHKEYVAFKKAVYNLLDLFTKNYPTYKAIMQDMVPSQQPKEIRAMVAEYALGPTDERKQILNRIKGIIQDSVSDDLDKIKKADEELAKLINENPHYLIELKDETGYTPLHMAVHANALGVVKLILGFAQAGKGPDSDFLTKLLNATTINGLTPLQLAHYLENKAMIQELEWTQNNLDNPQILAPGSNEPSEDDKAGMSGLLE